MAGSDSRIFTGKRILQVTPGDGEKMYKKAIQNLVLITAVLAICIGWLGYRYQTEHETILVRKMVDGKATDVSKKVKKFPLNLGLDIKGS